MEPAAVRRRRRQGDRRRRHGPDRPRDHPPGDAPSGCGRSACAAPCSATSPARRGRSTGCHELAASVDVLAVALPLTQDTHGIISADVIGAMRPGAVFVNVGRGDLVDEPALVAALAAGRLGGAGLDVFSTEPLPADSPLWDLPNVIITPHNSANTGSSGVAAAEIFLTNLARVRRRRAAAQRALTAPHRPVRTPFCPSESAGSGPFGRTVRGCVVTRAPPRYCRPHRHPPGPSGRSGHHPREVSRARHRPVGGEGGQRHHGRHRLARPLLPVRLAPRRPRRRPPGRPRHRRTARPGHRRLARLGRAHQRARRPRRRRRRARPA